MKAYDGIWGYMTCVMVYGGIWRYPSLSPSPRLIIVGFCFSQPPLRLLPVAHGPEVQGGLKGGHAVQRGVQGAAPPGSLNYIVNRMLTID